MGFNDSTIEVRMIAPNVGVHERAMEVLDSTMGFREITMEAPWESMK